ncbi:MAG: hypothetical protein RLY58_2218 [Pseudomonadota bacterium]|jgi:rhomboid protease GluP
MNAHTLGRPVRHWWMTAVLIGLNVFAFVVQTLQGTDVFSPTTAQMIAVGSNATPLTLTGDDWRLLSSMFLHVGLTHLVLNMWALYLLGTYAELYFGRWFYVGLYLLSGLVGNIAFCAWHMPNLTGDAPLAALHVAASAGASGAILGLNGALIMAAWRPRSTLPVHLHIPVKGMIAILGMSLAFGVVIPNMDNTAHLAGASTGLLLGWLFVFSQPITDGIRGVFRTSGVLLVLAAAMYCFNVLHDRASVLQPLRHVLLMALGQP